MPKSGEAALKYGVRYELLWTARRMLDVMQGEAQALRLVPPSREGEGVEFYLKRGATKEFHQVKRQASGGYDWSLRRLRNEGVLPAFAEKLHSPNARCVFVSTQDATTLRELTERASKASCLEEFQREFLKTRDVANDYSALREEWGGVDDATAFDRLMRTDVRTIDVKTLEEDLERLLFGCVQGEPATALDVLVAHALDQVHNELDAGSLWSHLARRGISRRDLMQESTVAERLKALNESFVTRLRESLLSGQILKRDESTLLVERLLAPSGPKGAMVVGVAGIGKSCVLLEAIDRLDASNIKWLAISADRLQPVSTPDHLGKQLSLPGSPALVLDALAGGRTSVLVIDQLDAVSRASGRAPELFDCVRDLVDQAVKCPSMRVMLACREFDLDGDPRLGRLVSKQRQMERVVVGQLSSEQASQCLTRLGLDSKAMPRAQVDLFRTPLHLYLLEQVVSRDPSIPLNLVTPKSLFDLYWHHKQDEIRERTGRVVAWTEVVQHLCRYMSDNRTLTAPETLVDSWGRDARDMASAHVLFYRTGRYSFFHQSFFDYSFARLLAASERRLLMFLT